MIDCDRSSTRSMKHGSLLCNHIIYAKNKQYGRFQIQDNKKEKKFNKKKFLNKKYF